MAALVTLMQAKRQLRLVTTEEDEDVLEKIAQASALVIDYVDNSALTADWDEDSAPQQARAAALEMLLDLYERDTAQNGKPSSSNEDLPPRVVRLLRRLRKPALA